MTSDLLYFFINSMAPCSNLEIRTLFLNFAPVFRQRGAAFQKLARSDLTMSHTMEIHCGFYSKPVQALLVNAWKSVHHPVPFCILHNILVTLIHPVAAAWSFPVRNHIMTWWLEGRASGESNGESYNSESGMERHGRMGKEQQLERFYPLVFPSSLPLSSSMAGWLTVFLLSYIYWPKPNKNPSLIICCSCWKESKFAKTEKICWWWWS